MKNVDRDRRKALSYRVGTSLAAAALGLLVWLLWQVVLMAYFQFPAAWGIGPAVAWMLLVTAAFLWVYAFPRRGNGRARARSRIRSPGRAWGWVAFTAPAIAALPLALASALMALGLAQEIVYPDAVQEWLKRPGAELAFVLMAVAVAPLLEEFGFRAWIQRPMERRLGAQPAIALASLLFALAHNEPDFVPVYLAGGLVLGHAVYATRSVWAGVALHVAWNAGALAFGAAVPDWDPTGKGWVVAAPAAGVAALSLVWCAWGVRRMHDAAAARRDARGAAPRRPVESS
jgi:membrane protease YdiL (CAAX protease family)